MNRFVVCLISLALFLSGMISLHGQSARMAVCPDANPVNRPGYIDLTKQSKWVLQNVVNWMHKPEDDVLTPGKGLVLVVSHRGNWEYCPENTLESFHSAWDLGAVAIEMDIRLSAAGQDGDVTYPKGEAFLSHDFDIRGEAPNPALLGQNYIASLPPASLRIRNMADRHGLILKDSSGNHLHLKSLTDLLTSIKERATALNLIDPPAKPGDPSTLHGGAVLILDIKEYKTEDGIGANQYETFVETLKEFNDFQFNNKIRMNEAVIFKVGFEKFIVGFATTKSYGTAHELERIVKSKDVDYISGNGLPQLIFIVFPEDACKPKSTVTGDCPSIPPGSYEALNDYGENYPGLISNDWQYRNEGDALAPYIVYSAEPQWSGWKLWGSAMFLASNNFSDGVRNSAGNCRNGTHTYDHPPFPNSDYPAINLSGCVSDPIQRWASSSLDYLVPSFGPPKHATTITTDQFQNAIDYLISIGLNNQDRLNPKQSDSASIRTANADAQSTSKKK